MSVNQSAESTTSSLQRSGLSITVGDTKSIVLALQALQSKIRSLEQDRDYHQDQYEVSLQAHERYKLDVERQMEQERAAHRKREADLLELLRKAREERAELESALNGNKEDLGGFRKELEEMIASEKELALQRESKLNKEVTKLREEIKEEQTRRAALLVTVDKLREEREAALSTNEQLRVAMDDLLTRYEQLQHQRAASRGPPPPASAALPQQQQPQQLRRNASRGSGQQGPSVSRRGVSPGAHPQRLQRGSNRFHHTTSGSARARVVVSAPHHNYEDPTCSSMLRDVRVVPDEAPPCHYPSVNSSLQQQQLPHEDEGEYASRGVGAASSGCGCSPARRGVSAHSSRGRTASASPAMNRTHSQQQRQHQQQQQQSKSSSQQRTAPHGVAASVSVLGSAAMQEVERQMRRELEDLQRQYEDTVARGTADEIPSEILAAALHRVSSLVDQKKEQLKLLREARFELESASGPAGQTSRSGSAVEDKQTRRTMLVNELRSLLAEASN